MEYVGRVGDQKDLLAVAIVLQFLIKTNEA